MSFRGALLLGTLAFAWAIGPVEFVSAHHSYAAYDMNKRLSSPATLREFYWGAPHSSGTFLIKDKDGKVQQLTLQGAAPTTMARQGFKPKDMRPGIKVEVTWHPLRDGSLGGALAGIKFPDGRSFKDNNFGDISTGTGQ